MRLRDWLSRLEGNDFASVTLINNAAVLPRIAPLTDASRDDITSVLRVGLEAPLQLSAAFLDATANWTGSAARAQYFVRQRASRWRRSRCTAPPKPAWTITAAAWRWKKRHAATARESARWPRHHRHRHADPPARCRRQRLPRSRPFRRGTTAADNCSALTRRRSACCATWPGRTLATIR